MWGTLNQKVKNGHILSNISWLRDIFEYLVERWKNHNIIQNIKKKVKKNNNFTKMSATWFSIFNNNCEN